MLEIHEVCRYADRLFADYALADDVSNNGLQVEVGRECRCVAFAVDACLDTIEGACQAGAQLLMVHHGISWRNGFRRLVGNDSRRLEAMYSKGVSLYASHLPLDVHPEIGNNGVLARRLELENRGGFACYQGVPQGVCSVLSEPMLLSDLLMRVRMKVNAQSRLYDFSEGITHCIGIVSGRGDCFLPECIEAGIDCLITGEFLHSSYYLAMENGVSVIVAGHYATEDTGIRELMAKISQAFPVKTCFIDAPTGL